MKTFAVYILILVSTLACYAQTPCENGFAGNYPCNDYDLMSHINLNELSASAGNDSWGWTDPETGSEYALMGLTNGTAFINITDPINPIYLGKLPTHTQSSSWRDIKVYGNYAFIVSEASDHGMQVFDLTRLRNVNNPPAAFDNDAHYDGFGNAHNLVINEEQDYAYAVGTSTFNGGAHIVDISNPLQPVFAGAYADSFYTHDAQVVTYDGPDSDYTGREIYIGSNEDEVVFVDVTDPSNTSLISTVSYSNIGYTHQGWLTEDQGYFFLGDETDELGFGFDTKTIIFDVQDLDNPSVHMDYFGPTEAIDHNGYIHNNTFYLSNYNAGIRIVDVTDVGSQTVTEIGFFDTYPENDNAGFSGVWSNYPFFESGNIVVSDIDRGFFLIRKSGTLAAGYFTPTHFSMYPNPARSYIQIENTSQPIKSIELYNLLGQLVLSQNYKNLDQVQIQLEALKTGLYMVRINKSVTKKLIID